MCMHVCEGTCVFLSLSLLLLQSFYACECFACMCDCALAVCLGPAENRSGHQIPWIRSYRCCESLCRPWDWKSSLCCQHWPCLQSGLCPTTLALRQDFSLNWSSLIQSRCWPNDLQDYTGPFAILPNLELAQCSTLPRFLPGMWTRVFTLSQQALYWLNSLPSLSGPKVEHS